MTATTRNGTGVTAALVRLDDVVFHTHNVRHDLGDLRPRRLLDHGHTRTEIADIFGVADATIGRWLNTGPRRITSETRRNYTQLTAPKVRGLVADWRIRDATAATILDELDQLFAPKDG
jgi:transposase